MEVNRLLYSEFLEGTGAVDNESTRKEYKRVEQIYMQADLMTKEDAYRMARVEKGETYRRRLRKQRKLEKEWVIENIIPAAAHIRAESEKGNYFRRDLKFDSECGNRYMLKEVYRANADSIILFEMYINGELIDVHETGRALIDKAEIGSCREDWYRP